MVKDSLAQLKSLGDKQLLHDLTKSSEVEVDP